MIKQLLAAVGLMTGVAFAQTYIPTSPPAGAVAVPGSTTTTTTTSPTTDHRTTIAKGVDANGNEVTKKDSYREGIAGSSESHTTTANDPTPRPANLAPVFESILDKALRLCEAASGALATWDGEYFNRVAIEDHDQARVAALLSRKRRPGALGVR